MQLFSRTVIILAALVVLALVTASLLASGTVWGRRGPRMVNVGGSANSCHCSSRLER
ncbi:MAG: hypothetical protein ACP5XB_13145 [Isosphaeraceae bacterium]